MNYEQLTTRALRTTLETFRGRIAHLEASALSMKGQRALNEYRKRVANMEAELERRGEEVEA